MSLFYSRTSPKIIKVTATPPLIYPIEPSSMDTLLLQYGDALQYGGNPEKLMRDRMFIYAENWQSIVQTDEGVYRRWAKKGCITDFGSIPGIAEAVEKRDDRRMLCAYLNHDIDFSSHLLDCQTSGCQLYQTGRYFGKPKLSAWYIWRSVTSDIAERIYDSVDVEYERNWCGGEWLARRSECNLEQRLMAQ